MKAIRHEARRQLEQFLSTLFLPNELIELRFNESWLSGGTKQSRVVRAAEWLRRDDFVSQHREIADFAGHKRANVYFGVCPRPKKGDSQDDQIQIVRCLWCDIDDVSSEDAFERWNRARVPRPSIVVSSGSGIHAYWLLDREVQSRPERASITALLPHFYRSFGGDHVQNPSRILRPPGTLNCKDSRNGRSPRLCTLLECQPDVRYSLRAFARWTAMARTEQRLRSSRSARSLSSVSAQRSRVSRAGVAEILRHFDKPSRDRSRRDFAVVCDLLRLGLTPEEIWPLVASSSKFASNGRPYFDLTIANAQRTVCLDPPTVDRRQETA